MNLSMKHISGLMLKNALYARSINCLTYFSTSVWNGGLKIFGQLTNHLRFIIHSLTFFSEILSCNSSHSNMYYTMYTCKWSVDFAERLVIAIMTSAALGKCHQIYSREKNAKSSQFSQSDGNLSKKKRFEKLCHDAAAAGRTNLRNLNSSWALFFVLMPQPGWLNHYGKFKKSPLDGEIFSTWL